ncbi:MAG: O-antigen ligase family protein [Candidatus Lernaella stagnicola]|nr:O-antigen ligase family protein [Candidatus Lernaella stagnicola]
MIQQDPLRRLQKRMGSFAPVLLLILFCALLGIVLLKVPWYFVIAGFVVILVALAVVAEPYYGVLLYLILLYVRPGDMFHALTPLRLTLLGVLLLTGAFVLQVLVYRRVKPIMSKPLVFMGLFFLVMLCSLPGSFYRSVTLSKVMEVARIVYMTYLIVHLVQTVSQARRFMTTMVLVMAGLSTTIFLRFVLFPDTHIEGKGGSGGIAGGFLGDGNDFALAQNVILPWAIALVGTTRSKIGKLFFMYCIVIGALAVIVTYSRGGFLGLISVFIFYYLLWVIRNRAYARGMMLGLIAVTLTVVAFIAFAPDDLKDRVSGIQDYEEDESALGRLDAWGASVRMFVDHPLFGVGAGAFATAYGTKYFPPDAVASNWREAHSVFFQVLGELGISGIIILYALVGAIFFLVYGLRFTRLADRGEDEWFHAARAAVLISICGWLVSSMFLSVAYYPHLFLLTMLATTLKRIAVETPPLIPEFVDEIEEIDEIV